MISSFRRISRLVGVKPLLVRRLVHDLGGLGVNRGLANVSIYEVKCKLALWGSLGDLPWSWGFSWNLSWGFLGSLGAL